MIYVKTFLLWFYIYIFILFYNLYYDVGTGTSVAVALIYFNSD